MGLFRVLWTIIRNWKHREFRRAIRVLVRERLLPRAGTDKKSSSSSPEKSRPRRAETAFLPEGKFTEVAPDGEKKSTGTFIADKGEVEAELARRGLNLDGTPKKRSE